MKPYRGGLSKQQRRQRDALHKRRYVARRIYQIVVNAPPFLFNMFRSVPPDPLWRSSSKFGLDYPDPHGQARVVDVSEYELLLGQPTGAE